MSNGHESARCQLEPCQRCQDYGQGYAAGKDKLAFEIQTVLEDLVNHNHDSPCSEACRIVGVAFVEFLGGLDAAVFRRATQADD